MAIEPDYGGMIEYPPEIAAKDIWINALTRAGADPFMGRKLPGMLRCAGLECGSEFAGSHRAAFAGPLCIA